jgi:hypothetical protein
MKNMGIISIAATGKKAVKHIRVVIAPSIALLLIGPLQQVLLSSSKVKMPNANRARPNGVCLQTNMSSYKGGGKGAITYFPSNDRSYDVPLTQTRQ